VAADVHSAFDPAGEGLYDTEYRIVRPDGEQRWLAGRGHAIFTTDGQGRRLVRAIGTGMDITERKRAEEKLRQSEERLRLAKSAAQLGIHDFNPATGGLIWDNRVRELWGVGPEDPVSYEVFMSRIHPADRAATQAAVDRALDPGGPRHYYAEYRLVHADQTLWIAATG
jgi:PAS domain-containing protein